MTWGSWHELFAVCGLNSGNVLLTSFLPRGPFISDSTSLPLDTIPNTSSVKRRQTYGGLNSRFDRMIETVNVIHTPQNIGTRSRRRVASGSSSTTSQLSEVPTTPSDLSLPRPRHRNGRSHAAQIEITSFPRHHEEIDHEATDGPICGTRTNHGDTVPAVAPQDVPHWLASTVATLGVNHPLRGLIPVDDAHILDSMATIDDTASTSHPRSPPIVSVSREEDDIFAFRPPSQAPALPSPSHSPTPPYMPAYTHVSLPHGPDFEFTEEVHPMSETSRVLQNSTYRPSPEGRPLFSSQHLRPHTVLPTEGSLAQDSDCRPFAPADNLPAPVTPFSIPGPFALRINSLSSHVTTLSSEDALSDPYILDSEPFPTVPFSTPGPFVAPTIRPYTGQSTFDASCSSSPIPSVPRAPRNVPRTHAVALQEMCSSDDHSGSEQEEAPSVKPATALPTTSTFDHCIDVPAAYHVTAAPSLDATLTSSSFAPTSHLARAPRVERAGGPASNLFARCHTSSPLDHGTDCAVTVDHSALDFRWKKFDRSGRTSQAPTVTQVREDDISQALPDDVNAEAHTDDTSSDYSLPLRPVIEERLSSATSWTGSDEDKENVDHSALIAMDDLTQSSVATQTDAQQANDAQRQPTTGSRPSSSTLLLNLSVTPSPVASERVTTSRLDQLSPHTPSRTPVRTPETRQPFAPAPGIYISPLRGEPEPESGQSQASPAKTGAEAGVQEPVATDSVTELSVFSYFGAIADLACFSSATTAAYTDSRSGNASFACPSEDTRASSHDSTAENSGDAPRFYLTTTCPIAASHRRPRAAFERRNGRNTGHQHAARAKVFAKLSRQHRVMVFLTVFRLRTCAQFV